MSQQKIIALLDGRAGNDKQTLSLAESLGKFERIKIQFNQLANLPNFFFGNSLIGVNGELLFHVDASTIIISAGRKLARVSAHLKNKYNCKNIHILYPGNLLAPKFDYIITPAHDNPPPLGNIIKITGAVTALKALEPKPHNDEKNIVVLIGNITSEEASDMCGILNINDANYLITTSRRTSARTIEIISHQLAQPKSVYQYGSAAPNPYYEYLDKADIIVVTGDSVNMLTEAAHTGKPLYIMETETKPKFVSFWQKLYSLGCAKPLTSKMDSFKYKPLNNIDVILKSINLSS